MRFSKFVQVCVVLLTLMAVVPQQAAAQCKVNEPGFQAVDRHDQTTNFMDYGRIHVDADIGTDACALQALYALTTKLTNTTDKAGDFGKPFAGGEISLIFAAALRLGDRGLATQELHTQLVAVLNAYTGAIDPNCGLDTVHQGNTCFDDYTIAASGYAWIAAYEARRGTPLFGSQVILNSQNAARQNIDTAFGQVCIHNPVTFDGFNLCNGSVANLLNNTGSTLSLNHGLNGDSSKQEIAYGFGLLTSVSSALLGLEASGTGASLSSDQQTIAKALAREAELHITPGHEFMGNCWQVTRSSSTSEWTIATTSPCAGEALTSVYSPYHPDMYQLDAFFDNKYVDAFPTDGTYRSNSFNVALFALAPSSDGSGPSNPAGEQQLTGPFSFGRLVTYRDHGHSWVVHAPGYLPYDIFDPTGYVDGIDGNGSAYGWACDQDVPMKAAKIDFWEGDPATTGTFYGTVRANLASESAVNSQCGGTAHRFTFTLPPETSGRIIRAYALDYTYFGLKTLQCSVGGAGCYTWSDTAVPVTAITAPGGGVTLTGITAVSASASDNVGIINKVEFYLDGTLANTDTISPYAWSWNTTLSANTTHTLVSKAYDAAGNIGTSASISVTVSNLDTTAPTTITSFTPASGCIGTTVTITGTGLGTVTAVKFNGVNATSFTIVSATSITAVAPAAPSVGKVSVESPAGSAESAANFSPAAECLLTPQSLVATPVSATQINLAWSYSGTGQSGFKIERKLASGTMWTQIVATTTPATTTYSSMSLTTCTGYVYRVRVYAGTTNGAYSNEAAATTLGCLSTPTTLTATPVSATQINLAWSFAGTGHAGFKIERRLSSGTTWSQIAATTTPTTRTYSSISLTGCTGYVYRVRAYAGTTNNGPYSNEAAGTTAGCLATPASLTAAGVSNTQINLSWTYAGTGHTGFKIERRIRGNATWSQIIATTTPATTTYSSTALVVCTEYEYRVRAYSGTTTNGPYSNEATGATLGCLTAPASLVATPLSATSIQLTWSYGGTGHTGFKIERRLATGASWSQVAATTTPGTLTYTNTFLTGCTQYRYRVRAYTSTPANSLFSNEATATTTCP